jgi:peptidoglycan-N-acetylglucosamine deacetylase
MLGTLKLLLVSSLFYESIICRIDVANLVDSFDYHKRSFKIIEKSKTKGQIGGKIKDKLKSMPNSGDTNEVTNSPFSNSKLRWRDELFQTIEAELENVLQDKTPVREANKKFRLPNVIEKCVRKGDIALTFDDGVSRVTQNVLDILKNENVKATFFIIGNTLDSPILGEEFAKNILAQMVQDGHVVASHSYSHPNFDEYWPEGIQHEMNRAKGLFQKHIGKAPRFMRPPFGNTTPRAIEALHDLGYFIIRWNVDTNDWMYADAPQKSLTEFSSKLPDEAQINNIRWQKNGLTELGVRTMVNTILDSKIALMHDIHAGIVHFLPGLIRHARSLGYKFVSMDECLGGINPYFDD